MQVNDFPLDFHFAYGAPSANGVIKRTPEHFYVEELLDFDPCGHGEHLYLQIEKLGLNTQMLARQLASLFRLREMDVGYAGLKDRHAVTRQWFSLYLPKIEEAALQQALAQLAQVQQLKLLEHGRHTQKLRRGAHAGNRFCLRLVELDATEQDLLPRLQSIASAGVPNYFGPQRFGFDGQNLQGAQRWFVERHRPKGRHLQGLYLSAARSYLFNRLLSQRVAEHSWCQVEEGDIVIETPCAQVTGPLWGRGRLQTKQRIGEMEARLANEFDQWCHALEHSGLQQERRSLCLMPTDLSWVWEGNELVLNFNLPVGGYATSLLRELLNYQDCGGVAQ